MVVKIKAARGFKIFGCHMFLFERAMLNYLHVATILGRFDPKFCTGTANAFILPRTGQVQSMFREDSAGC